MNNSPRSGYLFAVAAFVLWGLAPIYFKFISSVPPTEIVAHRVIWSVLTFGLILLVLDLHFLKKVWIGFKQDFRLLFLAATLLAANWLVFIYAISVDRILEATLGYYINPLLNIALGAIVLGERFSKVQKIAIGLAVAGVAQEMLRFGQIPWLAIFLASTFSVYGLIRKKINTGGTEGLLIETLILLPFALVYLLYLTNQGAIVFYSGGASISYLLALSGLVTSLPLIFFISASKRLRYSTIGMFQYIGPTIMGFLGYYIYAESFPPGRITTFALVWVGLLLTMIETMRRREKTILK